MNRTPVMLISLLVLGAGGCTVDSNVRTTLGGPQDFRGDEAAGQIHLPALSDPGQGTLTEPSTQLTGLDRSDWALTNVHVPAHDVRHGAFIGSNTLIEPDTPRWAGFVPTADSALTDRRDPTFVPQVLEVPLVAYSFAKDLVIGGARVLRYGPAGWHASPRWGGQRTFDLDGDPQVAPSDDAHELQPDMSEPAPHESGSDAE